jgi:hypothetical protein
LTLLEAMLALAILGLSIAATGELVRIGMRSAAAARDLTTAQLLCESKMAEISAGIVPAEPVLRMQDEFDPEWVYSIEQQIIEQPGLLAIRVTVEKDIDVDQRPISFSLVRWIPDPSMALMPQEMTSESTTTGGTTSGSTSQSTGGMSTGGTVTGGASQTTGGATGSRGGGNG